MKQELLICESANHAAATQGLWCVRGCGEDDLLAPGRARTRGLRDGEGENIL